jgi:RecJ-like exonuclease
MKLEESLKHFSPQGMHISDSVKGTSPDRITGTDVMAAIGTTSSRARFGLAAFFGKAGISKTDEQLAVQALARYATEVAPKNVRKAAGTGLARAMLVLAQFAYSDYAKSAASEYDCPDCSGKGVVWQEVEIEKYPGLVTHDGRVIAEPRHEIENTPTSCTTCAGRGKISARCRCKGVGRVLDRKATKEQGAPVFKECERCAGRGFIATPSTAAYKAILKHIPDLHVRTWTRNWKPFYDALVDKCGTEERRAAAEFSRVIDFSDDDYKI